MNRRNVHSPALAMVYIPVQALETVFAPEDALANGTLFPELYKPFRRYREGGVIHG
ncbi:MAG: spore coat associated protein CotJA [Clostridia bacterium]|nr:spore coat associated protein CotJA [Clostridia bacterium]